MLLRKKERDFAEMMLHHVTTISLIYFSHIINTGQIGYLILWIHLWADIFLYAARAFGDIPNHWMSTVNFGLMLLVWPYSRLYVFADLIYWASKVDFREKNCGFDEPEIPHLCIIFFLSLLYILHWYWYSKLLQILYVKITKGKFVDVTNEDKHK